MYLHADFAKFVVVSMLFFSPWLLGLKVPSSGMYNDDFKILSALGQIIKISYLLSKLWNENLKSDEGRWFITFLGMETG